MMEQKIDWTKCDGLLPVITQQFDSGEVLMMAYMNEEALNLTLATNEVHYFSRTKQRIWKKGESSGHIQQVKQILVDCDNDTVLIKVDQVGVACHTGRQSCFFTDLKHDEAILNVKEEMTQTYGIIETLYQTISSRRFGDPEESYTAKLLQGKQNSMLKKICEEASEFTFAIKDGQNDEIVYECADLAYHILVALASKNISPDRVKQELAKRFGISGIAEKNSRINK
jgi:phosphoribosyl-ATP pyrophosphohydrolase/phosphoribosyl-AMP cyclohydrolase